MEYDPQRAARRRNLGLSRIQAAVRQMMVAAYAQGDDMGKLARKRFKVVLRSSGSVMIAVTSDNLRPVYVKNRLNMLMLNIDPDAPIGPARFLGGVSRGEPVL